MSENELYLYARKMAHNYFRTYKNSLLSIGVDSDDLVQEANIVVIKTIRKYSITNDRIKAYVIKALRWSFHRKFLRKLNLSIDKSKLSYSYVEDYDAIKYKEMFNDILKLCNKREKKLLSLKLEGNSLEKISSLISTKKVSKQYIHKLYNKLVEKINKKIF